MIFEALKIIAVELNTYLISVGSGNPNEENVLLDNIALAESLGGSSDNLEQKIVLSLVNVAEEFTLKNNSIYRSQNDRIALQNPLVYVNLYLLFSANDSNDYENSLKRLGAVMEFFQGKSSFSLQDSPNNQFVNRIDLNDLKLILELHTLTFEQINHLWGALGGKQLPFVMYRARLVSLKSDRDIRETGRIREVNGEEKIS